MTDQNLVLKAPERLAVAYASVALRSALRLLLAFDNRLADVVGSSREPMIAQMKIAWWYDAVGKETGKRPKGEPILQELDKLGGNDVSRAMEQLLDAWGKLLSEEIWSAATLEEFARCRSEAIFGTYGNGVGGGFDAVPLGKQWAIADLRQRFGSRVGIAVPAMVDLPKSRKWRPLSILVLATGNPSGTRMIWHALTGR